MAAEYVKEHLSKSITQKPGIIEGRSFASMNSTIIKFIVCSASLATLQSLLAGMQVHRAGNAESLSLGSRRILPSVTTIRSRPSCGGDQSVLPGTATVHTRTSSISNMAALDFPFSSGIPGATAPFVGAGNCSFRTPLAVRAASGNAR